MIARSWPGMDGDIDRAAARPVRGRPPRARGDRRPLRARSSAGSTRRRSSWATRSAARSPQILLDRGLGAAGVAIDAAAVKGITALPLSTLKSALPGPEEPCQQPPRGALTPEEFHYAFTNTLSEEESRAVYERYAVPGPGRVLFQAALANFNPHAATQVDFEQRRPRAAAPDRRRRRPRSRPSSTASRRALREVEARSPRTRSSPAARTTRSASPAGRRSPTTRSSGRWPTRATSVEA